MEDEMRITEQVLFMTTRLPATPARILDAGCGRGELALALTDRGYDVTAIDISPEAVAEARKAGVDTKVANNEDYEDDPFDAVVFSVSLHHVERLDRALARTRELLKPGGVAIADEFAWERATPTTAAWFYDMAVVLGKAGLIDCDDEAVDDPLRRWWQWHRDDDPSRLLKFDSGGAHGYLTWKSLTWLGQVDLFRRDPSGGVVTRGLVSSHELTLLLRQGLELKGTYDFYDPDKDHDVGIARGTSSAARDRAVR